MKFVTLLCCINLPEKASHGTEFTFYEFLSAVAPIRNLKLICNQGQAKAFVQLDNQQLAEKVIKELNGKTCGEGKIKIFVYRKRFIAFDKPLQQVLSEALLSLNNTHTLNSVSENETDHKYLNTNNISGYDDRNIYIKQPKEEMEQDLNDSCQKYNTQIFNANNIPSRPLNLLVNKYLRNDCKGRVSWQSNNTKNSYSPIKIDVIDDQSNLRMIRIDNINTDKVSCQMIFNLFGSFGNIIKLWFIKEERIAFMEYESFKHARRAFKSADSLIFFNSEMRLSISDEFTTLNFINRVQPEKVKFVKGSFKFYRYKDNTKLPIGAFNTSLHFTNISSLITVESLCLVISQLHKPVRILQVQFTGFTTDTFIVEFNTLSESLEVLSLLHNRKVQGRKFYVEFIGIDLEGVL